MRSVAIILARYQLRKLKRLYSEFDHDMMLPMLLGEIALYNIGVLENGADPRFDPVGDAFIGPECALRPCNAYSIAAATGLPRETVRRKIGRLVELGWIERSDNGQLCVSRKTLEHFGHILQSRDLPELLEIAERVRVLVERPAERTG